MYYGMKHTSCDPLSSMFSKKLTFFILHILLVVNLLIPKSLMIII